MPKFKLSLVGIGGHTVGEGEVEKISRDQAITMGLAEVLEGPGFPPEAAQFVHQAFIRSDDVDTRNMVSDLLLEKWGLQVFCEPVKEIVASQIASSIPALPSPPAQSMVQSTSLPLASVRTEVVAERTPRQMLRDELKRLNRVLVHVRDEKLRADRNYNSVKLRRDQCLQLLGSSCSVGVKRRSVVNGNISSAVS
jgi:hypothetical protein